MPHNENSRVKIPALVHFTRLGYEYISLKKYANTNLIDEDTNIFLDVFCRAINDINGCNISIDDARGIVNELKIVLDMRKITTEIIRSFKGYLINEEKAAATVNKYVHDVTEFQI